MNEYIKIGVGAVIIRDGKALLTKRKGNFEKGAYGSVGGHVEFGESPMEAVIREAKEELDIEIGNLKLISCLSWKTLGRQYLDISFLGDIISGEPKIMETDKIESVNWYSVDNLPQPLFEPVRIVFEAVKTGQIYFEI